MSKLQSKIIGSYWKNLRIILTILGMVKLSSLPII